MEQEPPLSIKFLSLRAAVDAASRASGIPLTRLIRLAAAELLARHTTPRSLLLAELRATERIAEGRSLWPTKKPQKARAA